MRGAVAPPHRNLGDICGSERRLDGSCDAAAEDALWPLGPSCLSLLLMILASRITSLRASTGDHSTISAGLRGTGRDML